MTTSVDLYAILNVSKGCSQDELKKSYKKLCIQHHPDKGGDENEFKKITEAYNILKDPEKRSIYDRFGMDGLRGGGVGNDDILQNIFGFKFPFQNNTRRQVQQIIQIPLEEIVNGNPNFVVRLKRKVLKKDVNKITCNLCKGQGFRMMTRNMGFMQMQQQVECPQCHGTKYENTSSLFQEQEETFPIPIPKNCPENHTILLQNKMDDTVDGVSAGDVVLVIQYQPHPQFKVKGNDLFYTLKLSFIESIVGFSRVIQLLNHTECQITYPTMIRWNKMLSIPKKGLNGGNLNILFDIVYPDDISLTTLQEIHASIEQKKSRELQPDTIHLVDLISQQSPNNIPNNMPNIPGMPNIPNNMPNIPGMPFSGSSSLPNMECNQQ